MKSVLPYAGWILLIILAVILTAHFTKGCSKTVTTSVVPAPDSTGYYKNKLGQTVATLTKTESDFAVERKAYLDSIAVLYKTKADLISEIVTMNVSGYDSLPAIVNTQIIYKDTGSNKSCPAEIYGVSQIFSDPYYEAVANIVLDSASKSSLSIHNYDTVTFVFKTVTTGSIFNRQSFLELDAHSANPHNQIAGLHLYKEPEVQQKQWGIGLQAGYGYTLQPNPQGTFFVGIGIQRTFIHF